MRRCLTAAAVAACVVVGATSAAPLPFGHWTGGGQRTTWIAQQSITPTTPINSVGGGCLWSVDDHELFVSNGYLDAGAQVDRSKCVVADARPVGGGAPYGYSTARLSSKSADLRLTVCFSQGRCFTPSPVYNPSTRRYIASFCGKVQYLAEDPALVPIEGSLGGVGEISTVTTTISNPTGRRVRDVFAEVGYASDIALFAGWPDALDCLPTIPYVDHFEYPYEWTSS